jgi:hypothetical protein
MDDIWLGEQSAGTSIVADIIRFIPERRLKDYADIFHKFLNSGTSIPIHTN